MKDARIRKPKDEFAGEKLRLAVMMIALAAIAVALSVFGVFYSAYGDNMFKLITPKDSKAAAYADADDPQGKVIFFGDSLTEFCDLDRFYPSLGALNRGIAGDTTDGMLDRIESNVVAFHPSKVVFLGGVNDLHHGASPEQITQNISEILRILTTQTDADVIVQSLYPVNPDTYPAYMNFVADRSNADIDAINAALPAICEQWGCTYVDVRPVLTDSEGKLIAGYTPDGLHLNSNGYRAVASVLSAVLEC